MDWIDAAAVMKGSSRKRIPLSSLSISRAGRFASLFSLFDPILGPSPVNKGHWRERLYRSDKGLGERLDI